MLGLSNLPAIVAHQGGWDEALLVAAPLAVIGLLLWLANKRVDQQLDETKTQDNDNPGQAN